MIDSPLIDPEEAPIPVQGRGILFMRADGVPCVRLADGTVKSMQGEQGPQGQQGPQGPQGEAGSGGGGGGAFLGMLSVNQLLALNPADYVNKLARVPDTNNGNQLCYSDGAQWLTFDGPPVAPGEQ